MKKRKYHGFIPKVILLILLVIGSLSASFNKPQNHIVLADKSNNIAPPVSNISKCIQEIDLSNSAKNTHTYNLRTYNENSQNLLIKSNEAYYTLILTDLQESKNVVTLLDKKNIKLINNVIIIGTNSNVLKSIKYKNMYLLNDKSNLNLTLSTLGEESKLQSLSIYYNKNAEPSTKVIMRTKNNIKNTTQKSSSTITIEKCVIGLIALVMCLMLVNLLYLTFKKPKNISYMIKKLIRDTWNELNRISIILICICWFILNGAMYILNDYAVNRIIVYTWIALSIFILFMTIMATKSYKLLKSINQEKFENMRAILCSLFGITAYCIIMTISLNTIHIEFSNVQQKLILFISSSCLITVYILNMHILYNLIIYRCKIVKKSTPQKRFFNFCFLSIFVIICFISIFTSANFLSEYIDPYAFKDEPLNSHTTFDIFYYSASTFLTFCSENISAHTMLSKFICLLSKITTIISITVLISILTALLPEDVDNYDKKHTKKIPNRKNNSFKHNKNAKNRLHN